MKTKLSAFIAAIAVCVLVPLSVFAASKDYTVKTPAGFVSGYSDGDLSRVAKTVGMDENELKTACEKDNISFIAVNEDNTVQIKLMRYKNAFSEKTGDISGLTDEKIASELTDDFKGNGYEKTAVGSTVFLKTENELSDSGGKYTSKQYLTVKNGIVYQLSFYFSEGADETGANELLASFKITEKTVYSTGQKVIIGLCIAAFLILIGFMIYGIIKDIRKGDS